MTTALICTTAPLAAFFLALVVFRKAKALAASSVVVGGIAAAVTAIMMLQAGPKSAPLLSRWFDSELGSLKFGFLLDGPTLLMGSIVACVALLIVIYSLGYMKGDGGWTRYFAMLGLFTWSMLSFVYSANLLQMFVFWELVGLASFFLIGFWFEKPSAAKAAWKAFVMTRIGDVGLFIGLALLFQSAGTLDIATINQTVSKIPPDRLNLIALLLFMGVVGKSAQFPLHTWLPDAMEGPTPVSALLHSATMVAAGVFLVARFHPVFMAAPAAPTVIGHVAVFTAILAATMAMVANDMKRVFAYSSISQLGFMLLGLAAGGLHAGLFHLTTHALFKALLFLCAGAYIHHYHTNDLINIGRAGGRSMKLTTLGLLVGGTALAGIPPLSGFFSKESILFTVAATGNKPLLYAAYFASFLTAYYTFRLIFLVLFPNKASAAKPDEPLDAIRYRDGAAADDHAHDDHGSLPMQLPIAILSVLAAIAGLSGGFIAKLTSTEAVHAEVAEMIPAIAIGLAGVLLAWFEFGRKGSSQTGFIGRIPALEKFFQRGWYIDEIYAAIVGNIVKAVSAVSAFFEQYFFDGSTDALGMGVCETGKASGKVQSGRFPFYIGTVIVAVAVACYFLGAGLK